MKEIRPENITDNVFKLIGKDYLAVTVKGESKVNAMTASWGGLGQLWNKPVATIYLRPSRYTKELIDSGETFSLCVLNNKAKNRYDYLGSHSGRDEDKMLISKLKVNFMNDTPWIDDSRLVLFCRKLYSQPLDPFGFSDEKILKQNYRNDDFHTMYIAEITKVLIDTKN
ncbi:MAG: flavin reductase [Treponema sp.]|nr:flavin reductase [Treponema sp.]